MKVKIARIKKKIKQQELAKMVGISREYLRHIENDEANPTSYKRNKNFCYGWTRFRFKCLWI